MNNYNAVFNSNDVFELLLIGTLYLFKTSVQNSYDKKLASMQLFSQSPLFTPNTLNETIKGPIIVEGIAETEKPIFYQEKDVFNKEALKKTISLISLYKLKAPFFFNPFDMSSNEYYKEANTKPTLSREGFSSKVLKAPGFYLKDYHNSKRICHVLNKAQDDRLSLDFLYFVKKYQKIDFYTLFRIKKYGTVKKHVGIKCGVYMGVYGEFSKEKEEFICKNPLLFFRSKGQVITKMEEDLEKPKFFKNLLTVACYGAMGYWSMKKGIDWARLVMNNR